jgi:hypothetical protein
MTPLPCDRDQSQTHPNVILMTCGECDLVHRSCFNEQREVKLTVRRVTLNVTDAELRNRIMRAEVSLAAFDLVGHEPPSRRGSHTMRTRSLPQRAAYTVRFSMLQGEDYRLQGAGAKPKERTVRRVPAPTCDWGGVSGARRDWWRPAPVRPGRATPWWFRRTEPEASVNDSLEDHRKD